MADAPARGGAGSVAGARPAAGSAGGSAAEAQAPALAWAVWYDHTMWGKSIAHIHPLHLACLAWWYVGSRCAGLDKDALGRSLISFTFNRHEYSPQASLKARYDA